MFPIEITSPNAIMVSAILATVGWLYAARRSRALSKKQQTINIILNANLNELFLSKRAKIAPYLIAGTIKETVLDQEDRELRSVLRDILNHYEFVAAGLRNGDFDEKLIKDSEKSTYTFLFKACERYIYTLRYDRERRAIYEHLEWVYIRWEKKPPNLIIRFLEIIRGKPFFGKQESLY